MMKPTLHLITFASVFQKQEAETIRMAHEELFEALSSRYELHLVFSSELTAFLAERPSGLTVVFIATGGTEGMVVRQYQELPKPLVLLTDGKANSLAASLELGCWTRQQGDACTILHGSTDYILQRLQLLEYRQRLMGKRIGVIGEPSDWLVSSGVDYVKARQKWGVEFVDVSLQLADDYYKVVSEEEVEADADAFLARALGCKEPNRHEVVKAMRLYRALKRIAAENRLDALTLQCFSLIPTTCTTGCLALALLNDEGIIAGCEGDLPSIFTMLLAAELTGEGAFMANPSRIDVQSDEVLFAHCTIGLKQTQGYIVRSHFESQSGVAIQGIIPTGEVTVLKFGGKGLDEAFIVKGTLLENQDDCQKCRTQIRVRLEEPGSAQRYFLSNSIGNHHIIISGDHAQELRLFAASCGVNLR